MERINRDRVLRLWSLILHTKGKSKYKRDFPRVLFFKNNKKNRNYGEYTNYDNTIKIWWKEHEDLKELASTMLHEYAHYLQFWPWYVRYKSKYKYDQNPYEIQAKNMEKMAPLIVSLTRDEFWYKMLSRDRKLRDLYYKNQETIEVE